MASNFSDSIERLFEESQGPFSSPEEPGLLTVLLKDLEGEDSFSASLITPSKRQRTSSPVRSGLPHNDTDSILMWSLEEEWEKLVEQNETIEFEMEGSAANPIILNNDSATSEDTPNTKQIQILVRRLEDLQNRKISLESMIEITAKDLVRCQKDIEVSKDTLEKLLKI